jgi:hypothetical protein
MKETQKPPIIPEQEKYQFVAQLLTFIENQGAIIQKQAEQIQQQAELIQQLKDEIACPKNQTQGPKIKPSQLEKKGNGNKKGKINRSPGSIKERRQPNYKCTKMGGSRKTVMVVKDFIQGNKWII